MAVGVRDYFEKLFGQGSVGYDEETKGVNVTHGGQTYNLGNAGLTLGDDNRYYADSEDYLAKLFADTAGWEQVRAPLQQSGQSVGWNDGKLITGGHSYNTNTGDFVNAGGTLYTSKDNLERLKVPQYGSKYDDRFEEYLRKLSDSKFSHDPDTDRSLQQAQGQVMQRVGEEMNSRGLYDSSFNVGAQQRAAQELIPQYEQMAYGRYRDEKSDLQNMINNLSNLDSADLQRWQANQTQMFNQNMQTLEAKKIELDERDREVKAAWSRTEATGFVSNEDAATLKLGPGTPSQAARERVERIEDDIARENRAVANEITLSNHNHGLNMEAADAAQGRSMNLYTWQKDTDLEYAPKDLEVEITRAKALGKTNAEIQEEYGPQVAMADAKTQSEIMKLYPELFTNARTSGGGRSSSVRRSSGGSGGGGVTSTYDIAALLGEDDGKAAKTTEPVITNQYGDSWVHVVGYGRLSWDELESLVKQGKIIEREKDGRLSYVENPNVVNIYGGR